jgi:hypothetical protein
MPTFNLALSSVGSGSGDWLPYVLLIWLALWLWNLAVVLVRSDFDAINRLTWVIVLIFVPFFGIFLYWFIAPNAQARIIEPPDRKRPERRGETIPITPTRANF